MKTRITYITTVFFIVLSNFTFAQFENFSTFVQPYLSEDSIQHNFYFFSVDNQFLPGQVFQEFKGWYNDEHDKMILKSQHTDSLAYYTHYRYQQYYKNIPVEGAFYIEHFTPKGKLDYINAKVSTHITQNATPQISALNAVSTLIDSIQIRYEHKGHPVEFAWQDSTWENQIKSDKQDSNATWYPKAKLIWAIDTMKNVQAIIQGDRYKLAYKVLITTIKPSFNVFTYYINANNGAILKYHSNSLDASGNDIQADVYSYGPQWLDADWQGGLVQKFRLFANDQTHNIHTKKFVYNEAWDNMPETRYHAGYWGNTYLSETSPHFYATITWDFFRQYFSRTGMDGDKALIRIKAEWKNPNGSNHYNADYLNLTSDINLLRFGYASTNEDYGFEPSVVAHEFTHGITHYTAGLDYSNESGALNESFSDIFGTVVQAIMLEQTYTDWIVGDRIPNTSTGERSLKDPNDYGTHWSGQYDNNGHPIYALGQPAKYHGQYWCNCPGGIDNGGVHINSGVQNHWFYLLSYGSSSLGIQGIGMMKAAKIAYSALTNDLIPSSEYINSSLATIKEAGVLFGSCSQEQKSTVKAWTAVGIYSSIDCSGTNETKEWIKPNEINVYPNPTDSKVTINSPVVINQPITVFDAMGRKVGESKKSGRIISLNLGYLDEGLYFVHLTYKNQHFVKRVIINK